ncbi:MAG TPA: hypothetical protein VGS61_05990, partial [Acidimicrobiales bacterium]|nr:hypothetical protein [Acidimicrobiales bacterium]
MISLDDARAEVLGSVAPLGAIDLPLARAGGLVTAEGVTATTPVPPFANSSMDGYALRAEDSDATLRVTGTVLAGDAPTLSV